MLRGGEELLATSEIVSGSCSASHRNGVGMRVEKSALLRLSWMLLRTRRRRYLEAL